MTLRDPMHMPRTSTCQLCGLAISKLTPDLPWREDMSNTQNTWPGEEVEDSDTCAKSNDGQHMPGFIGT